MEQHLTLHVHQLTTMDRHRGEQNRSIENAQAVPATRPSTLRRYCACAERATLPALRLRHGCGARRQWTAARALSRRRRPLVSGKGAAAPGGPLARHRQLRVAVRPVAVDDADLNAGRGSSSPPANGAYPWHGLARTESRCRDQGQAGAPGGEHKALENLLAAEAIAEYVDANAWQIEEIRKAVEKADAGGPFVSDADATRYLDALAQGKNPKPSKAFRARCRGGRAPPLRAWGRRPPVRPDQGDRSRSGPAKRVRARAAGSRTAARGSRRRDDRACRR